MKIVLYKNVAHNYDGINKFNGEDRFPFNDDEYVVMSEIIDIDFPMLNEKTLIDNQVAIIDKQMTKVRADAEASITALEGRKQELLAIGHEVKENV